MFNNIFFCALVVVLVIGKSVTASFCYWNSGCPYNCFSSKTPYSFVRGDIRDSAIHIKGCEPISIWTLMRHGKNNPTTKQVQNMKYAVELREYLETSRSEGRCSLCAQDVENLKKWNVNPKLFDTSKSLTEEGQLEMKELGNRLKQAFPKLFTTLDDISHSVVPVLGIVSDESAQAFIKGISNDKFMLTKPFDRIDIAAPYAKCEKYQKELEKSSIYEEANKYHYNSEYLVTKDRIQRRSGIDYAFTDDNITALYDLCRYDSKGFGNKSSPWCALFTTEDLKVLEYEDDLKKYYKSGYGNPMSERFGRLPMSDLLKTFKQVIEGKGKKFMAYITHGSMLEMVYTTLGIFKDKAHLGSANRHSERKWNTCKLSTFSSNFMAVLNRCTLNELDEYNVVLYMNEEPLMSICKLGVCTWEEFENKLTYDDVSLEFCNT